MLSSDSRPNPRRSASRFHFARQGTPLRWAVIVVNDNWGDTDATEIHDAHVAPSNLAESAIIIILVPGNYTAIVSGKNGGTGAALVEVYNIQ